MKHNIFKNTQILAIFEKFVFHAHRIVRDENDDLDSDDDSGLSNVEEEGSDEDGDGDDVGSNQASPEWSYFWSTYNQAPQKKDIVMNRAVSLDAFSDIVTHNPKKFRNNVF